MAELCFLCSALLDNVFYQCLMFQVESFYSFKVWSAQNFKVKIQPITRQQILDSSKLKEFVDDNFKFDENGRKLSKWVENTVGKGEIACYKSVFKGLVSQGVKRCHCVGMG